MIEYDKWLYVRTHSAEQARQFFGVPTDWPCELDHHIEPNVPIWRVLSPAYLRQQAELTKQRSDKP